MLIVEIVDRATVAIGAAAVAAKSGIGIDQCDAGIALSDCSDRCP